MTTTANTTDWLTILTAAADQAAADLEARRAAGAVTFPLGYDQAAIDLQHEVELILGHRLDTEQTAQGRVLVADTPAEAAAVRQARWLLGLN